MLPSSRQNPLSFISLIRSARISSYSSITPTSKPYSKSSSTSSVFYNNRVHRTPNFVLFIKNNISPNISFFSTIYHVSKCLTISKLLVYSPPVSFTLFFAFWCLSIFWCSSTSIIFPLFGTCSVSYWRILKKSDRFVKQRLLTKRYTSTPSFRAITISLTKERLSLKICKIIENKLPLCKHSNVHWTFDSCDSCRSGVLAPTSPLITRQAAGN